MDVATCSDVQVTDGNDDITDPDAEAAPAQARPTMPRQDMSGTSYKRPTTKRVRQYLLTIPANSDTRWSNTEM